MTTTFTHLAHLELLQGTLNQPFGLFLFSCTVAAALIGGLDLLRPGRRWKTALAWVERRETFIAGTLIFGMIGGWVYKVCLIRGFFPWSP